MEFLNAISAWALWGNGYVKGAVLTLAALWLLWYLYLIVMGLYRAHMQGRLSKFALVLGSPMLALGFLLDWVVNWTVASVVFFEPPPRLFDLVTERLARYLKGPDGFRKRYAKALCDHLLDPFDPSADGHCR